jgi:hypothetical protein
MLRSKAAWLTSRPGNRWRLFGGPVSVGNLGAWKSFKYQGGYYIALSTLGPISWIHYSTNLTNWTTVFILRSLTDIAFDGTHFFCTSDNNFFGFPGVVKFDILAPSLLSDYGIGSGLVTKTIDWSPGVGKFIIGVTGGALHNLDADGTTWSALNPFVRSDSIPKFGVDTDAGIYTLLAESNTPISGGVQIYTINSALARSGIMQVQGSLDYSGIGTAQIPGSRAPILVMRVTDDALQTSKFSTLTYSIPTPPTTPIPLPGFTRDFSIPYTQETLTAIASSYNSGTLYIITSTGQVWESNDYGTSWTKTFMVPAGTKLAISSPKGIAIGYENGYILASPSPLATL